MIEQSAEQPGRPKILLLGDASARPTGLERALTRAGFQLVEREDSATAPASDAVLITLTDLDTHPLGELLTTGTPEAGSAPPRLVILSAPNPDATAAALAMGAADALVAPVHLPELCARLYARIRDHHQPVAAATSNGRESTSPEPASQQAEALERKVQEEFERARRYSLSFSLVLLGIDELSGPDQPTIPGEDDRIRSEVGQLLRRELRLPDFVTPYGAGEFAIILPETDQGGARLSVARVRERLATIVSTSDPRHDRTHFSAGIVTYPHPAAFQPDDLFAMAEAALMRGRVQAGERIGIAL